MSFATLAGSPVSQGTIRFPLTGTWEAMLTLVADSASKFTGRVSLEVGDRTLQGTIVRADADSGGLVTVRMVGGANGLGVELEPNAYRAASRRVILRDALDAGGEMIATDSDSAFLDTQIDRWTRPTTTVGELCRSVLAGTGYAWRIGLDGAVLFAQDAWPEVKPAHTVEAEDPTMDELTVALEGLDVLPGNTFLGRQISAAAYVFDEAKARASLSYDPSGRSGMAAQLGKFIAREMGSVALLKPLSARVIAQNGDGTLEIRTSDPTMPDLQRVPIQFGIAGISAHEVAPGTECYLVHHDGDPRRPVVVGFAPGSSVSLSITSAASVKITSAAVEAGGQLPLALATPLALWAGAVVTALTTLGQTVPPLSGVETQILKGA